MPDQKRKYMIGIPENNLPPSTITPEQAANDWQASHDQDYPAVFEAADRARAKAYAHESGLTLTLEYISRLERIAEAARAGLPYIPSAMVSSVSLEEAREAKENLYNALQAVDCLK